MSRLSPTRREQNQDNIRKAAIDLAYEHGVDNVTTEMICEKVGFSLRTFFNYFPFKEAAFVPKPLKFSDEDLEVFTQATSSLLNDFLILLLPTFNRAGKDKELIKKAHIVAKSNHKLFAMRMNAFNEFDNVIADTLIRRLNPKKDQDQVNHMAVLLSATIRHSFRVWIDQDEGDLAEIVEKKIRAINIIFNE